MRASSVTILAAFGLFVLCLFGAPFMPIGLVSAVLWCVTFRLEKREWRAEQQRRLRAHNLEVVEVFGDRIYIERQDDDGTGHGYQDAPAVHSHPGRGVARRGRGCVARRPD